MTVRSNAEVGCAARLAPWRHENQAIKIITANQNGL